VVSIGENKADDFIRYWNERQIQKIEYGKNDFSDKNKCPCEYRLR